MRPGWNPARRNRNIGTSAQGHGADNKLVIPESRHRPFQRYWEKLNSYVLVRRQIGHKEQLFFVEPTQDGWFYPCTVADICRVLSHCPGQDIESFDFIVMRQPTRKQRILCAVWGRAHPAIDIDQHWGSAIIIEAQSMDDYSWGKSLSPERERELERLRKDGHTVVMGRRQITISSSAESMRNTVLFRTLLHEIGHHIDFGIREDRWDERTSMEKEDFAHRYADEQQLRMVSEGVVPFAQQTDPEHFAQDGLKQEWFLAEEVP